MRNDPYYQQILEQLADRIDPDVFEEAVISLLHDDFPGLVLVRGGSDGGMDGSLPNAGSGTSPVITTTSEDAIGNLTRNLESFVRSGQLGRRVVFVTSRELSPVKKRNLHDRARELGFELINAFDRHDLAQRLYRRPEWSMELLGITGVPSALSPRPASHRVLLEVALIGRSAEFQALMSLSTDAVLVGQPGSGKTFLAYNLAKATDDVLFVESDDSGQIAAAVRVEDPRVVIVDDAHAHPGRVQTLRRLRDSSGARFAILAITWPWDANRVWDALGTESASEIQLDRLSRDEIVRLVHTVGVTEPLAVIGEIVNQAEGRPGLAATLAHQWQLGLGEEVVTGRALLRIVERSSPGPRMQLAKQLLAAISLGGSSGMDLESASNAIGASLHEAYEQLVALDSGGVITQERERYTVRPAQLRYALIHDVFFGDTVRLPNHVFARLVRSAPSQSQAAIAVFGSHARHGGVPFPTRLALAEQTEEWSAFAHTDLEALDYALENHPLAICRDPSVALRYRPREVCVALLEAAISDRRALNSNPDHPLRHILAWIQDAREPTPSTVERRRTLLGAVRAVGAGADDSDQLAVALEYVFETRVHFAESDPGAGMTITVTDGAYNAGTYRAMHELWDEAVEAGKELGTAGLRSLVAVAEAWVRSGIPSSDETAANSVRDLGVEKLRSLAQVAELDRGLRHRLSSLAAATGIELNMPRDTELEILYPDRLRDGLSDLDAVQRHQAGPVEGLVAEWATASMPDIIERLTDISTATANLLPSPIGFLGHAADRLASRVPEPGGIGDGLMAGGAPARVVLPFLAASMRLGERSAVAGLLAALAQPTYSAHAAELVLCARVVDEQLVTEALEVAADCPSVVETAIMRGAPEDIVIHFLSHHRRHIAEAAVRAAHHRFDNDLPTAVRQAWREALVRAARVNSSYVVTKAVSGDPVLASDWLRAVVDDRSSVLLLREAIDSAVGALDYLSRRKLLAELPTGIDSADIAARLVGDDLELFDLLLDLENGSLSVARILSERPVDGTWEEMVMRLIARRFTHEKIVNLTRPHIVSWSGSEQQYWLAQAARYEHLLTSASPAMRELATRIVKTHHLHAEQAARRERNEAVYGLT